jgi:hypothetical protein
MRLIFTALEQTQKKTQLDLNITVSPPKFGQLSLIINDEKRLDAVGS